MMVRGVLGTQHLLHLPPLSPGEAPGTLWDPGNSLKITAWKTLYNKNVCEKNVQVIKPLRNHFVISFKASLVQSNMSGS